MKTIEVTKSSQAGTRVSETILGHNIEMCLTTADGLLSDRLRNPKFTGPPHRMTGIAPEWQGASCGRAAYELTPGGGLEGSEAQLIRVPEHGGPHLHQNKLQVREGEELEFELWARAWHEPVKLEIQLLPLSNREGAYDTGEITIDTPYYTSHTVSLKPTRDDDEARLSINVVGGGELWVDQVHLRPVDEPLLCQDVVDEMENMRIPTLRFPGGIVCNAYNWQHGTGPAHLRPRKLEAAFHQDWYLNYDFGLDEYLQICLDQGITPAMTFNLATGTPDEAEEWARYCADWYAEAGVELPDIYWHIGNHPYAYTTGHMTPEMYVQVLKTFVPKVKEHCPNCRIVGVMHAGELTNEESPWKEALLSSAAHLIDVVEVQTYGSCSPTAEAQTQARAVTERLEAFESNMSTFIAESRERDVDWNTGIAEWNWWLQASHWDGRDFEEPPTVLHGLYIAGMIHRFAAMAPDFEVAHFYNLVNCMGILNHRGPEIEVTDSVRMFKLYRPAFPGRYVTVNMSGESDMADVDAMCMETEEDVWLFISNRDNQAPAQIALNEFPTEHGECIAFLGDEPTGNFSQEQIREVGDVLDVPPLSVVRVQMPKV